jgi:ABC-type branched-subunit amino acid transport system permease subunit
MGFFVGLIVGAVVVVVVPKAFSFVAKQVSSVKSKV